jgi:hypothetical protein
VPALQKTKSEIIRDLNDSFRHSFIGGKIVLTSGVAAVDDEPRSLVLSAVRTFATFDEGNDPHQEHDFGAFEVDGERYFFKIDYYDKSMQYGSEDPTDPQQTTRVITIMRADEY